MCVCSCTTHPEGGKSCQYTVCFYFLFSSVRHWVWHGSLKPHCFFSNDQPHSSPSPPQYQESPWTHRMNAFEIESVATVSVTLRWFITQTDMMRRHLCDVLSQAPVPLMWSSEVRTLVLSAELNGRKKPVGRAPGLLLRQQRIQSSHK